MENKKVLYSFSINHEVECPVCSSKKVDTRFEDEVFEYGSKKETVVELIASIPVRKCNECGFEFTDVDAEDIRHDAVCRHLGRMNPQEIRGLRKMYGLTRKQFSEVTLLGEASLARWETGELIQNAAYDQLLHLLLFRENFNHLTSRGDKEVSDNAAEQIFDGSGRREKFRSLNNISDHVEQAKAFRLTTH